MKSIKIQCKVNDSLSLDKLTSFQGSIKNLSQENHEKLKTRILEKGFRYPLHIWVDPEAKSNILDSHQRLAVLCDLEKEGYNTPPLPVHYVYCEGV